MKTYIGCKIIQAEEMDEHTFLKTVKGATDIHSDNRLGYKVVYPDGYISWSPRYAFEAAYREVSEDEKAMILPTGR